MNSIELNRIIEDADMVLVGIGEEFRYDWNLIENDQRYLSMYAYMEENNRFELLPFLQKYMLEIAVDERISRAYEVLGKLLNGKNYFIVSTEIDDYIYRSSLNAERIVTPCGGFRKLQCEKNCDNQVWELEQDTMELIAQWYQGKLDPAEIEISKCDTCGTYHTMNQLGVEKYCEQGYLDQWSLYTKWLQGTMNRKLCILELGMGLQFPSVFRWPAEKLVFYNQKAKFIRVHSILFQVSNEIIEKSYSINKNPVEWLLT